MTHKEYVEIIQDSFVSIGVRAIMADLVSRSTFFALPFFNPITKLFVEYIVKSIAVKLETQSFFWFIDMRVGAQGKDFEKAALENFIAQREGTPEEKKRAEENLKIHFRALAVLHS